MAYKESESTGRIPAKIVVAGGFGSGKTTFVTAVSEIEPLRTEAAMTEESIGVDDTTFTGAKSSTTVAMDFGRRSLGDDILLYLFGTPGQQRFWFMWENIAQGAIGAVVLADTRRLADCFAAIDFFEAQGTPFVVAVNRFDGVQSHPIEAIRSALSLSESVPLMDTDARDPKAVIGTLIKLVEHSLAMV